MASFKEFLTECDLWEYSDQNYQLMKEMAEFELLERYIMDLKLSIDPNKYLPESYNLPDGFFVEAGTNNHNPSVGNTVKNTIKNIALQKAGEAYLKKRDGILGTIIGMIEKFCSSVIRFITKINGITIELNKSSMSLLERLRMTTLSARDVKVYAYTIWGKSTGVNISNTQENLPLYYKNIIAAKQPFENSLGLKLAPDVPDDDNLKALKWALALGLSTNQIVLNGEWANLSTNSGQKQFPKAVPLGFLAQKMSDYVNAETISKGQAIINEIETKMANNKAITIDVSNNNAEHDKQVIEKLRDQISNTAKESISIKIKPQTPQETQQVNEQLAKLRECASQTLHMYSTYISARKNITEKLKVLLETGNEAYTKDWSKY